MSRETSRREQLADAATDHVLEHGLIGMSLRPLAAALGTSDRMLLYHFGSKADLIATILRVANDRAVSDVRALPRSVDVRTAVLDLWAAVTTGRLDDCERLYVEAAALGLVGSEPYASVVREANRHWISAIADHLVAAGCSRSRAQRAVVLLDAAFMGFQLDLPLDAESPARSRAVRDLADAIDRIADAVG